MNIRLLKSKMVLAGDNVPMLAEYLGQTETNVYNKLSGKINWTLRDMGMISNRYDLTNDEIVEIFIEGWDEDAQADCEGSRE